MSFRPVPHGRTAHRLTWPHLPVPVRELVERRLGSPVVDTVSCTAGFTPGFASVLTGADGTRVFVKAASHRAQRAVAASYAEEARKHRVLGTAIPAPLLRWVHDDDEWVVLAFEAIAGRSPRRPWVPAELDRALGLAEEIAHCLPEVPAALGLRPIVAELPQLLLGWDHVEVNEPDWPHRAEAARLARRFADLPAERFAHCDLRDDNVLLAEDGRTLACDWNWPVLAPPWIDAVVLMVSAYGDGLDVDPLLADLPLTASVPDGDVDAWLAALAGFMLAARDRKAAANSPHLPAHADFYARASWNWLCHRRGWARLDDLGSDDAR